MQTFTSSQLDCPRVVKRATMSVCSGTVRLACHNDSGVLTSESGYTFEVQEWTGENARTQICLWSETSDRDAAPDHMLVGSELSGYRYDGTWGVLWSDDGSFTCGHDQAAAEFLRELCDEILAGLDQLPVFYS